MKKFLAICMAVLLLISVNTSVFAVGINSSDEELYKYTLILHDGEIINAYSTTVHGSIAIYSYAQTGSDSMYVSATSTKIGFTFILMSPSSTGVGTISFTQGTNYKKVRSNGSFSLPVDGQYHTGTFFGVGNYLTSGWWVVDFTSSVQVQGVTLAVGS